MGYRRVGGVGVVGLPLPRRPRPRVARRGASSSTTSSSSPCTTVVLTGCATSGTSSGCASSTSTPRSAPARTRTRPARSRSAWTDHLIASNVGTWEISPVGSQANRRRVHRRRRPRGRREGPGRRLPRWHHVDGARRGRPRRRPQRRRARRSPMRCSRCPGRRSAAAAFRRGEAGPPQDAPSRPSAAGDRAVSGGVGQGNMNVRPGTAACSRHVVSRPSAVPASTNSAITCGPQPE